MSTSETSGAAASKAGVVVPWNPGDAVGKYSLLAKIAMGGMAEIWLARQAGPRGFEKVVVIKRILDAFSQDPEFVEMFLDEARIAAQLNHPNIVQIYDLGEHHGAWYIAMEYLAGEHLASVVRNAVKQGITVPLPVMMKIISGAAEGLAHAHRKLGVDGKPLQIVHRDVSPQNLVVTFDGQVKVVDFGIAKAANRGVNTAAGQVKGKFSYMAPEQAAGEPLDQRADVFALGVVAYEIATQARLFKAVDDLMVLKMVLSPDPVPLAHLRNPAVPLDLSAVLERALAKRREDRYPTANEFQRALDGWLATQGTPSSGDVAAVMESLFAERIQSRANLIETASRGELTPSGAQAAVRADTGRSMPGFDISVAEPAAPVGLKRLAPFVAALVVLGAGAGVLLTRGQHAAEVSPPRLEPVAVKGARLSVQSTPPGVKVALDGREVGVAPLELNDVAAGSHELVARFDGYQPGRQTVTLSDGDKATVSMTLAAAPVEKPPPPVDPEVDKKPVGGPARSVGRGKLSLDTKPWSTVSLGGRSLGETPIMEAVLPAGRHKLRLVNEKEKVDRVVEIEIKPGQTTVKQLTLK